MNLNDEISHNKRVLNSRFVASLLECDLIFRGFFGMACPTCLHRIGIHIIRPVHVQYTYHTPSAMASFNSFKQVSDSKMLLCKFQIGMIQQVFNTFAAQHSTAQLYHSLLESIQPLLL